MASAAETPREGELPRGPAFVFLVPLKPRSACKDWDQVQRNLRRTIRSARGSSAGRASIVVVCHDEPDLGDDAGVDVQVQRVSFPEPGTVREGGRDKARKRRFGAAWLRTALADADVYVMFLDADDLVHRNLVGHVLAGGAGSYLVRSGLVVDVDHGVVRRRTGDFHVTCGSSFACRFATTELPSSWEDVDAPFSKFGASPEERGHAEYHLVAAELGRPSAVVPFPGIAYVTNHGENLWSGKAGRLRPAGHARAVLHPRAARHALRDDFAAPDLAAALAGRSGVALAIAVAEGASLVSHGRRVTRRLRRSW